MKSLRIISNKNKRCPQWIFAMLWFMLSVGFLSAQTSRLDASMFSEHQRMVDLNFKTHVTSQLRFLVAPQFGGLFDAQFKYVEGILNLRKQYSDFDLALTLGTQYSLIKRLVFHVVYNVGLLKLEHDSSNKIPGAYMRAGLTYNF
ncbi:hypothetical protein [Aestuariivivens insulae]|uniref:hypothetical protein n=1 Tax=Aestuariivivens insulae TaxID=1621988 RepID=UPI001F5A0D48|nr:hypothetical protein [Aestuariivivens insulae]